MARLVTPRKNASINPLKTSTPMGAALAYLGIDGAVPLFHGAQGCSSFALTLGVRHFKEDMPLQTTAIGEVETVLGGAENLEEALVNVAGRMKPKFIGVASTALIETRGEDFPADIVSILRRRHELDRTAVVFASTPDFSGALEDGWAKAVTAIIESLVVPGERRAKAGTQINILAGVHQTAGDIDALRDLAAAFGLRAVVLPDLSGSLDGHVNAEFSPATSGGTALEDIADLGEAVATIAIGEHMRPAAEALEGLTGVPSRVFATLTGLQPADELIAFLADISGREVPASIRRQRSQLVDAMLDCHFYLGGRKIALGADPDLLYSMSAFFAGLGAKIVAAVTTTSHSPLLVEVPAEEVVVGDLMDLEERAGEAGAGLIVTHSHGRQAAERLGLKHLRVGFPIFDRLGVQHRATVGYAGTRSFLYEVANMFLADIGEKTPEDFASSRVPEFQLQESDHAGATFAGH
ncbi:nitrogenase iron-molybdenum cofactor biosynthesis protein NifN [Afifella sp. IM 167]|uniref:nitrogenase iron-molybdenum cofactor biosynthesis protein NifN n=1 Tax=Afifella sp. IM 167 TaxID=2033586 RepID=UPI001CCF1A16|nr:nitrogenase iron-molybdenum cofactor biosynthesis protein NifN [Afifella sp. IM 167]MBZ8135263.1 nitrogenase iron-molybdenum cofactor biosynthesis protein NifN [Afifella sp. IM 167]